jgi:hypothetical protein
MRVSAAGALSAWDKRCWETWLLLSMRPCVYDGTSMKWDASRIEFKVDVRPNRSLAQQSGNPPNLIKVKSGQCKKELRFSDSQILLSAGKQLQS